jgi:hypothetical protein
VEKRTFLTTVLLIGLLAAACTGTGGEPAPTETPPTPPPTATLLPPTDTPVPTSTPITPTETPTATGTLPPSDTPPPSPTPPPTLTPTPQEIGTVLGDTGVRVRSDPGFDSDVIGVVEPGDELLVLGADEEGNWFQVELAEGETGWIFGRLLRVEEGTLVAAVPTDAQQPSPGAGPTDTPTPHAEVGNPNQAYVLANCDEFSRGRQHADLGDTVFLYWGWVADTRASINEHVAHANYEITLNDHPVGDWRQTQTRETFEGGKPALYWYQWVGELPAGTYRVGYRVTWDAPVTDGQQNFGPGTENEVLEYGCTFVVE